MRVAGRFPHKGPIMRKRSHVRTSTYTTWQASMMVVDVRVPNGLKAINTLRPRQNGRYLPDDIFECIFLKENAWIPIKISLKFVPKSPINNIPALVQIMAWRRPGHKPLSEPMLVRLPTHICVTRPQWETQLPWTKWPLFRRRCFQMHFREWFFYFD